MSAIETFVLFLKNLEHQWDAFKKLENGTDEKNLRAEFNELISLTLDSCLDVSRFLLFFFPAFNLVILFCNFI